MSSSFRYFKVRDFRKKPLFGGRATDPGHPDEEEPLVSAQSGTATPELQGDRGWGRVHTRVGKASPRWTGGWGLQSQAQS